MKNKILLLLLCSLPFSVGAQIIKSISYSEYINKVRENNLSYAAEKLNIPIADAEIAAAKIFNDPSISFEYSNNQNHTKQMGESYSVELSRTFTIGKRKANINLAKSEKDISVQLLENFLSELVAESTKSYYEAIRQTKLYEVKQNSYESIKELAKGDSIKYALGKITEVDAMQSRVEEGIMHNELIETKNDLINSYRALNIPLGHFNKDTIYTVIGNLYINKYDFSEDDILNTAIDKRADLVASLKNIDVAKKALTLAHRENIPEFDLSVGYSYNSEVKNEIAPAPKFNGVTVGISVPLKFSSLNKGAIHSAKYKLQQAQAEYEQAKLEIQTEVIQNYHTYLSTGKQMEKFNNGLMQKSSDVLKGKIYSYNRGETSLLEVLNAQRTYNDVNTLYIEAQYNHAISLVDLEKSIGIWNIDIK